MSVSISHSGHGMALLSPKGVFHPPRGVVTFANRYVDHAITMNMNGNSNPTAAAISRNIIIFVIQA